MKYIILTFSDHSQTMIESLGPETVIGMVADVVRGNYDELRDDGKQVVKVELGNQTDMRKEWAVVA
jgi:hypothetical protein